ncbi:4'-phosphopantetheinyl transferase superfamily protein 2 [Achromobacter xylosoxidans A8]|uniref:4'-phosphopantetheinyl transferase superfamily protein 2 n=1 Tax=Achromobacter xylosoxidans (strain A8) TaxID=762376 RepID=E3HPT0_ACHXA|nr:4'-phosphopantetheinyl transferase superfamily protein [Achromobacter xylosoxidans]ADP15914.1 4'-phosphopantetheinyl transferase superfamily protein 2 [Achromobacter xylosoxidans A8]
MQPRQLSDLLPAGIQVFQLALDLAAPLADSDQALLSREEAERALRFHRHGDKVRFVSARAALRRLLSARLNCYPGRLRFAANKHGKPRLDVACSADPAPYFNVSHAGGFALIALSDSVPVGVDIERRDPHCDVASLSRLVLSTHELESPEERRLDFFDCWTAKEAVLKALGLGVAEHLQRLSVFGPGPAGGSCYALHRENLEGPNVDVLRLDSPSGYAAALAWQPDAKGGLR